MLKQDDVSVQPCFYGLPTFIGKDRKEKNIEMKYRNKLF